jgi:putative transposase
MVLTFQYRLLPSKAQHRALEAMLESQRLLYNAALEERIGAYRHGITIGYVDQSRSLTEWRHSDHDAASVPVNVQRATLKRVDEAYKAFFRRLRKKGNKAGFPRFRGIGGWRTFGFREFEGISLEQSRLHFKGMPGALQVHLHRSLPPDCRIRSCILCHDTKGWKVGFCVDVPKAPTRTGNRRVGIDLGIKTFATLSDGGSIPSLKAARRAQRRLRIAQRALARKCAGSRSRGKARTLLARRHAAIARSRLNHLHQASAQLVRNYDVIAIEALNIGALAKSALARDVRDASWGKFLSMLRYKAARAGVQLIEVDPRNSTQDCSACGTRVPKSLSERQHTCPSCGISIDRDLNAALNIVKRAGAGPYLPNVAECGMRAGGNLGSETHSPTGPPTETLPYFT